MTENLEEIQSEHLEFIIVKVAAGITEHLFKANDHFW